MNDIEKEKSLDCIYRGTHRDHRTKIDGIRHILVLRKGGTTLVPLGLLTDEEIEARLSRSRLWRAA